MFTIGEFSRLARVSKRLLRYYDEIGLLKPVQSDTFTGYRYYSAEQMSQLNRILALKDLGLSLNQIQRLLNDKITADEIQGMLLLKKAEIENQVRDALRQIQSIEARLEFIRSAEKEEVFNVVMKPFPAQPVLSARTTVPSPKEISGLFAKIISSLGDKQEDGLFFTIMHSDGIDEDVEVDVEAGITIAAKSHAPVKVQNDLTLRFRELPAVERMATFAIQGPFSNLIFGYSVIGVWAETNGFRFAGPPREVALQAPQRADQSDAVLEIQYPVEPIS